MSFIKRNTGKFEQVEIVDTVELCDICKNEMPDDVYPQYSLEVSLYAPPSYPNDGDETAWFHSLCSPECVSIAAKRSAQ